MKKENNIIFMDGEFTTLDPYKTNLVSIGLIKSNNEELYIELDFDGETDPWVNSNVIPKLKGKKIKPEKAVKMIRDFIGNSKPYLVTYVNQFDWIGICKLFNVNNAVDIKEKIPFFWIPIDFATILFNKGIKPGISLKNIAHKYHIDISNLNTHNALDDAKILKIIYDKLYLLN